MGYVGTMKEFCICRSNWNKYVLILVCLSCRYLETAVLLPCIVRDDLESFWVSWTWSFANKSRKYILIQKTIAERSLMKLGSYSTYFLPTWTSKIVYTEVLCICNWDFGMVMVFSKCCNSSYTHHIYIHIHTQLLMAVYSCRATQRKLLIKNRNL